MATMERIFAERDKELTQVFDSTAQPKMKALERAKIKKRMWLAEMISIDITDKDGTVKPGCQWRVARRKLLKNFIQELVNRSPLPCEIDYFMDSNNVAVWIDTLMYDALPEPMKYSIIPKVPLYLEDINDDPTYQGQVMFLLTNVPCHAIDGTTVVDSNTIKEYLLYAISEEDPKSKKIQAEIVLIEKEIKEIDRKMKKIPTQTWAKPDGSAMSVEEADEMREALFKSYGESRYKVCLKLDDVKLSLEKQREWRRQIGLHLFQVEVDANTDSCTWEMQLFGQSDYRLIEELLINKTDWQQIQLCCPSATPPLPPWVSKGKIPDGSKEHMPDYTSLVVKMSAARLTRVAHGVGTKKTLNSSTATIAGDEFGLYYGDWHLGKKTGYGIEVNDSGIYAGRFIDGRRDGNGRLDLGNGTVLSGSFSISRFYPTPIPTKGELFRNPYGDGVCNGQNAEVLFSDGGLYRGEMLNGRITGKGAYQSAIGEIWKGNFVNGILHGENGVYRNIAGETFTGNWRNGELHGYGIYHNDMGDSYEGHWLANRRHGRGYEYIKNKGFYRGYYINGFKSGKGELDFGRRKIKKVKLSKTADSKDNEDKNKQNVLLTNTITDIVNEDAVKELDSNSQKMLLVEQLKNRYQGFFCGGNIMNGGVMMDTISQIPFAVAVKDSVRSKPLTSFKDMLQKRVQGLKRINEKNADIENHIRCEMLIKKNRIFRQQRHYMKKTMYHEDRYGLDDRIYDARQKIREIRLKDIDEQSLKSDLAKIPRLQLKTAQSIAAHHLNDIYKKIVPDNDEHIGAGLVPKLRPHRGVIDNKMARIAISDFEEAIERQNMIKYDRLWARAEAAFVANKKKMNALASSNMQG